MLKPRFGAPPVEIDFPLRPTRWVASYSTPPTASSTPGNALMRVSTDSGNDGETVLFELPKLVLPLTTASAFWYETVKIVSKLFLIVSVRTYVPLIIATP